MGFLIALSKEIIQSVLIALIVSGLAIAIGFIETDLIIPIIMGTVSGGLLNWGMKVFKEHKKGKNDLK